MCRSLAARTRRWHELEEASGEQLYFPTGQLYLGARDSLAGERRARQPPPQQDSGLTRRISGAALAKRAPATPRTG